MGYTEKFSSQWDVLISNFISEIGKSSMDTISLRRVSEWYRANAYRWSSIVENEGLMLDQQGNQKLKNKLISAIDEFRFIQVEMPKKPSFALRLGIGVIAAAAIGGPLIIYNDRAIWIVVLESIACILASLILYAMSLDKYGKDASNQLCSQYVAQLVEYKKVLIEICEKNCN